MAPPIGLVCQISGDVTHKNIKNTLLYTQLIDSEEDECVCKIAQTTKEISQLIEDGFDYVCELQNLKFFKKRK